MKRNTLWIAIVAFALVLPGLAFGQAKVGTTGANFLKIGPSARATGMADALLPIADDASALWYNPGGLVNVNSGQVFLSHLAMPADVNYDFLGYVHPMPALGGAVGVQAFGLYTDDMIERTPQMPDGTGRTFTASDFALGVSYAQRLTEKFSVGATAKFIQENLADATARGWAVDVGTFYNTGWKSLRIAMMISNFGPDMEFISTPFPMPMVFKFASAMDVMKDETNRLTLAVEGSHPNDNVEELHVGLEYGFREFAFLRVGKKYNGWQRSTLDEYNEDPEEYNPYIEYPILDEEGNVSLDGVTFGGGLAIKRLGLSVDYAYANYGFLGSLHRFSLLYKIR